MSHLYFIYFQTITAQFEKSSIILMNILKSVNQEWRFEGFSLIQLSYISHSKLWVFIIETEIVCDAFDIQIKLGKDDGVHFSIKAFHENTSYIFSNETFRIAVFSNLTNTSRNYSNICLHDMFRRKIKRSLRYIWICLFVQWTRNQDKRLHDDCTAGLWVSC